MRRKAFSLVELLVVVSITLGLLAMMAAALSAARASGAMQKTKATIMVIDEILQRHFAAGASSRVDEGVPRGGAIRRQITADMPDSWQDVRHMRDNPAKFSSARQRGYVATLNAIEALNPEEAGLTKVNQNASAECLFMIVMQGGLADCLACAALEGARKGDKDGDGAPEFWDAWDEPIRYVLWPAGFQLPIGTNFFDQTAPFDGLPTAGAMGGTMRPLIVSAGPSRKDSTQYGGTSYLNLLPQPPLDPDATCGDPAHLSIKPLGGHDGNDGDNRGDNITNFDDEVKQ